MMNNEVLYAEVWAYKCCKHTLFYRRMLFSTYGRIHSALSLSLRLWAIQRQTFFSNTFHIFFVFVFLLAVQGGLSLWMLLRAFDTRLLLQRMAGNFFYSWYVRAHTHTPKQSFSLFTLLSSPFTQLLDLGIWREWKAWSRQRGARIQASVSPPPPHTHTIVDSNGDDASPQRNKSFN